jgi:hypothetical protein
MRTIILATLIALASIAPASAVTANAQTRQRLAITISDYIADHDYGKSNPFKTNAVEIGAAAKEGNYALADWRSPDGKLQGQVSFFYACDGWNVGVVTADRPLEVKDLTGNSFGQMPDDVASKLVTDVAQFASLRVAYLKPAPAGPRC